jgi:hypothetical protein
MLPSLGELTHLGVRSDGSGSQHAAWHLDRVCITPADAASGQPSVWFYAQRWLDAAHGLEVLLPALAADPLACCVPYTVQAYTSDTRWVWAQADAASCSLAIARSPPV